MKLKLILLHRSTSAANFVTRQTSLTVHHLHRVDPTQSRTSISSVIHCTLLRRPAPRQCQEISFFHYMTLSQHVNKSLKLLFPLSLLLIPPFPVRFVHYMTRSSRSNQLCPVMPPSASGPDQYRTSLSADVGAISASRDTIISGLSEAVVQLGSVGRLGMTYVLMFTDHRSQSYRIAGTFALPTTIL